MVELSIFRSTASINSVNLREAKERNSVKVCQVSDEQETTKKDPCLCLLNAFDPAPPGEMK